MYVKLDQEIINILRCALCKGLLGAFKETFVCNDCAMVYEARVIDGQNIFDFRILRPGYCMPGGLSAWADVQKGWEECYFERYSKSDDMGQYEREINGVKEIYTQQFNMKGSVLDVGGCEGKLRHFLSEESLVSYITVDPMIGAFQNLPSRQNALKAYPILNEPCNFLACHAENLPFAANSFDWVHMRSVLDHFEDPYVALKEAYRVLKPGGSLLLGLSVFGGKSPLKNENIVSSAITKFKTAGLKNLIKTAVNKMINKKGWKTEHMFHFQYEDLVRLVKDGKFSIVKEYWQKPPLDMCVYIEAKKP